MAKVGAGGDTAAQDLEDVSDDLPDVDTRDDDQEPLRVQLHGLSWAAHLCVCPGDDHVSTPTCITTPTNIHTTSNTVFIIQVLLSILANESRGGHVIRRLQQEVLPPSNHIELCPSP